jgi:PKD repeat protein
MKTYLLFLLFLIPNILFGQCTNADFESGNFSGWSGRRGDCCPIVLPNNGIVNGRQTIMSQGIDPNTCGGLDMVYSGNFSARLGNSNVGAESEALYYTFLVTQQSTLVQYAYAVVFEDPGHTDEEQPRFNSRVRLSDGSVISCTEYMVTAASNLSGFQSCSGIDSQGDPVNIAWRDWSTVSVDLSDYVGQTVTLEFETGDCSLGGHYGYAYIDAISCSSNQIDVQYCQDQTNATLSAPYGFATYLWETGETTPVISVNPTLYDSLSCFITTTTGCELTLVAALEPTIPTPDFLYVGECQGQFTFQNTTTISDGSIGTYTWNFGDGTLSNLSNPTHLYNTPGTYIVTLYVITDDGCDAQISKVIQVYPTPIASFNFEDVCLGNLSTFQNTSSTYLGYGYNYLWSFGDGNSSTEYSPTHQYQNPGTYNVQLIVTTDGSQCSDIVQNVINVRQNPLVQFLTQNNCQGVQSAFINTSILPTWSISNDFLWNFGNGSVSNQFNSNYTYPNEGTFNVSLTITSSDGSLTCESSYNQNISIYPNPGVLFTAIASSCVGDTVNFTNLSTISSSSQIASYNWSFGDGSFSNLQNPSHVYANSGVYNVTLVATSNYGCSRNFQNQIVINSNPVVSFTPNSGSGCPPLTMDFTDNSNGGVSWFWSFGDGYFSTLQNPTHTFENSGVYLVNLQVTNINGCNSQSVSPAVINVYPEPFAGFAVYPTEVNEDNPQINISNYSNGTISYFWNFGDNTYSNLFEPTHTYSVAGEYNISLIVQNQFGCFDSAFVNLEVKPIYTFFIPNSFTPSNDNRNEIFYGKGTNYKLVTMQIFNRWGEKIFDQTSSEPPIWDGTLNGVD